MACFFDFDGRSDERGAIGRMLLHFRASKSARSLPPRARHGVRWAEHG